MRIRVLLVLLLVTRVAAAQTAEQTPRGAQISGVVHDSLAAKPLAGAVVQLVAAAGTARESRTVTADSLGWYSLANVPDGRYMIGFFHPMLDSLGMESPLRQVVVEQQRPVRTDLAIPSPRRLRAAICSGRSSADSGAMFVGIVRDARDGNAVANAAVRAEWLEYTFANGSVGRRTERVVATTGENGWFALCNVPLGGIFAIAAARGADSTDQIEVQVPANGFLRRELHLGSSRNVAPDDARADSLSSGQRRVGDGRLSGVVLKMADGSPIAGAQVRIARGTPTRANEKGEWTLTEVPLGTRILEVRAVGYYPERRTVDVIANGPPIRVTLSTMKAVLDTIRVTAMRLDNQSTGFAERRRSSGTGRFITPDDIARRPVDVTSDLFRALPGVRITDVSSQRSIQLRGILSDWCSPAVYVNGHFMRDLTANDIDDWANPREVTGIEIYSSGQVPAQFQAGMSECGSIVIWSRPQRR